MVEQKGSREGSNHTHAGRPECRWGDEAAGQGQPGAGAADGASQQLHLQPNPGQPTCSMPSAMMRRGKPPRMAASRMPIMSRAVEIFLSTSSSRQFSYSQTWGEGGSRGGGVHG